ncbi:MAG: sigma factor-like helix-turn-helix DNA-binding protein [Clostridia bacterium]|nr:sigma factor-like helix-turn-helix DNA-binding protein [Clostridia bacterium]
MDRVTVSMLLDCYGALLSKRQRSLLRQSVDEDYSLAEIAERENISRQGVRDALQRAQEQLLSFEKALGLLERRRRVSAAAAELGALAESNGADAAYVESLRLSALRLIDELEGSDGI